MKMKLSILGLPLSRKEEEKLVLRWLQARTRTLIVTRRTNNQLHQLALLMETSINPHLTSNNKTSINSRRLLDLTDSKLISVLKKESHLDIRRTDRSDLIECKVLTLQLTVLVTPRPMGTWVNTKRGQTLTTSHKCILNTRSTERGRTTTSSTLTRMLLKCTQRCPTSWKPMTRCSMMTSPQRCLHLKTATNSRCFKHPRTRSRVRDQGWMATSRLNISTSSEGLPQGLSNSTTIWVIWCLSRAAETTLFTWLATETCFLTGQGLSALSDMVGLAANSLPLSWSLLETRGSFKLHAESITHSSLLIRLMFMPGEEASKDS